MPSAQDKCGAIQGRGASRADPCGGYGAAPLFVFLMNARRDRVKKNGATGLRFQGFAFRLFVIHLRLQVILQTDFRNQVFLRFQPVDVFFGVVQYVLEQFA